VSGDDREDREGKRVSEEEPVAFAASGREAGARAEPVSAPPALAIGSAADNVPPPLAAGSAADNVPPPLAPAPALAPLLDRQGFERAVEQHLASLRARAAQLCRGHGDADDLVQDALLRAFRAREQTRDMGKLRSWLLTIVTNTFLDSLRRRKARPGEVELEVDVAAPVADAEASAWAHIDLDDIRAAVAELPDDVREAYRMFALDGLDYNAVSAALGVPKATVGTRILRARKRLRVILSREHGL
jgi:RNA polymerase sigma-70 factor, ECF subfamily